MKLCQWRKTVAACTLNISIHRLPKESGASSADEVSFKDQELNTSALVLKENTMAQLQLTRITRKPAESCQCYFWLPSAQPCLRLGPGLNYIIIYLLPNKPIIGQFQSKVQRKVLVRNRMVSLTVVHGCKMATYIGARFGYRGEMRSTFYLNA